MPEKTRILNSVEEIAEQFISPGMHLHLSSMISRPNALIYGIARVFEGMGKCFSISSTSFHLSAHALVLAGVVKKAITCFLGDNYPITRPNILYRNAMQGEPFELEQWSILTYTQRLMAGAMNLPYFVTRSLTGSDLEKGKEETLFTVQDPNDSTEFLTLIKPLLPDYTLLHGVCADENGNIVVFPPIGEGAWAAFAAKKGVLATVEKIVPSEELKKYSDAVVIPGHRVVAICETAFGAHPQFLRTKGIFNSPEYFDDYSFMREVSKSCKTIEGAEQWYEEWVRKPGSHEGYLKKLGEKRLEQLTKPELNLEKPKPVGPVTDGEKVIAITARAIVEQVKRNGYETILAGVGVSHIASWVAAEQLKKEGIQIQVMNELGFYGMTPFASDSFLFSLRHAFENRQSCGVTEILGCMVAGNGSKCLGVLGAAEVDQQGNINSTLSANGNYIVGSGGANDIASTVDCIVAIRAGKNRCKKEATFITSPGRNVKEIICQLGRFEPIHNKALMNLVGWMPPESAQESSPEKEIHEKTDWNVSCKDFYQEEAINEEERSLIWKYDPEGFYR